MADLDAYYWNSLLARRERLEKEHRMLFSRYRSMVRHKHPSQAGQLRLMRINRIMFAALELELEHMPQPSSPASER